MITGRIVDAIATHLTTIVFNENATVFELYQIAAAFAVVWFIIFRIFKIVLRPLVHGKPWLVKAVEREYERAGKKMIKDLSIDMSREEYIAWVMNDWPRMQGIYFQHAVGAMFCVPSIFGWGDSSIASSLAICGILCEIGWEMQDMAEMLIVRFFFKNGKAIWPDAIIVLFAVHHSLASILGMPMILSYRGSRALHWICFDLQMAAALALSVAEYTKVLDTSNKSQLRQFKILNFIALVTMIWTRLIHWFYLCFDMFSTFYEDGAWGYLTVGCSISFIFTGFSYVCVVAPFWKKFMKFLHVSAEYESLPSDVTPERRRASVAKLELAAGDLIAEDEMIGALELLAPIFERRKVGRRQSVPVQPVSRKRRSLLIMQAKKYQSATHVFNHGENGTKAKGS